MTQRTLVIFKFIPMEKDYRVEWVLTVPVEEGK
jgi:hypothetical protein